MATRIAKGDSPTASLQQISRRGEPAIRGWREIVMLHSLQPAQFFPARAKPRADDRLEPKRHREVMMMLGKR
jgi:hypothetical protein